MQGLSASALSVSDQRLFCDFLFGLDIDRVGFGLLSRHLLGIFLSGSVGFFLTFFQAVFKALNTTTQVTAEVFKLTRTEHEYHDQKNDQPVPN